MVWSKDDPFALNVLVILPDIHLSAVHSPFKIDIQLWITDDLNLAISRRIFLKMHVSVWLGLGEVLPEIRVELGDVVVHAVVSHHDEAVMYVATQDPASKPPRDVPHSPGLLEEHNVTIDSLNRPHEITFNVVQILPHLPDG